jgi:hypothetical protein
LSQLRIRRLIFFGIMILVGIALGVVYGWVVNPVQYSQTGLHTLRIDYKTDFVLMIAELYQAEGDLVGALARLSYLGEGSPVVSMQEATAYAEEHNYAPSDLESMQTLFAEIERLLPHLE